MRATAVDMCNIVIGRPNITNDGGLQSRCKHSNVWHVQSLEHNTAALLLWKHVVKQSVGKF